MLKSKQTRAVVYSGKVGANTKPVRHKMPSKKVFKTACKCTDGPMKGRILYLTDCVTAFFTYKGQTGRYVAGKWEAV